MDNNVYNGFVEQMNNLSKINDAEKAHGEADSLLIDLLLANGYNEFCEAYLRVDKWYS